MNILPREKRILILGMLVEGVSMRSASRLANVSFNTVNKLLVDAGTACAELHDRLVQNVKARRVECDELWSFCYAKARNVPNCKAPPQGAGDVWTWTAIDSKTKLLVSFAVGDRSVETGTAFLQDVRDRVNGSFQLTSDAFSAYDEAVETVFGGDIDYRQTVKKYQAVPVGNSAVERHNLTMRMGMRRYTRQTNAFSKKIQNHLHECCLYFVHYNFCRIHQTLEVSPAMEAGISDRLYDVGWIVDEVDLRAPKPNRPKKYRPRISN